MQDGRYQSPTIIDEERVSRRQYKRLGRRALKLKRKQFPRSMRRYVQR